MTNIIPKTDKDSFQRWKFDSLISSEVYQAAEESDALIDQQAEVEVELTTEEKLALIHKQAQEEGYSAGYQAGKEAAEVEFKEITTKLMTLLSDLDQDLLHIDQNVAQDVLDLALMLTKKIIGQSLNIRPEIIIPIVQEAIRQLPSATQHPVLILQPDDASLVRHHLGDQLSQSRWEIREDEQIEKGGCRLEANGGEIDATLETRWKKVIASIGQQNNWLE